MILAIYIAVTFLLITWVALPMFGERGRGLSAMDEIQAERATSLLHSLKQLYDNRRAADEMADDDFANIERRLILDLARLYHQQGIQPEGPAPESVESQAAVSGSCEDCGTAIDARFKYCPKCGIQLKAA